MIVFVFLSASRWDEKGTSGLRHSLSLSSWACQALEYHHASSGFMSNGSGYDVSPEDVQERTNWHSPLVESQFAVDCHTLQRDSLFADTWAYTHVREAQCLPSQTDCI